MRSALGTTESLHGKVTIPAASPVIGEEERRAVDRVMSTGMLAQGREVMDFETEFSPIAGGVECVAVNSGTAALHLGLVACGVGRGDEVIVPSFTFAATANAVSLAGASPVFADIDPATFCVDPRAVESCITPRTVGIMPVHLYGHPADMSAISDIADRHSLAVFEDAAQAHMASLHDKQVGSFGSFAAFSFYPTKNMTSGEGGMVSTSDPDVARRVRLLRNQGMEQRYQNEMVGHNARMTDIHAAIGRVQLTHLPEWTNIRRSNARFLDENISEVVKPVEAVGARHVYHQYTVRVPADDREQIIRTLAAAGIGTGVYYPTPVHRLRSFGLDMLDLPETERASREVLSLPVHPRLRSSDLESIARAVNSAVGAAK